MTRAGAQRLARALSGTALLIALAGTRAGAAPDDAGLTFAPVAGTVGTAVVARATGLAANRRYALVWHTGSAHWRIEHANFYGIVAVDRPVQLATATSGPDGSLRIAFRVPEDFGYLHDVDVRPLDGSGAATTHQGFTVIPQLTISPRTGPAGTPITVTMTGAGYRFYQVVWHLLYDGAQTGWLSAVTTNGTARVTIPASGALGEHTLQAIEGPTAAYLNETQSPNYQPLIPTELARTFRLTAGSPRRPPAPSAQALPRAERVDPPAANGPQLLADYGSGTVGSPLRLRGSGFAARAVIGIDWETVVGNRLSGNGWETVRRPLARATTDASGAFSLTVRTPDDLGGPHRFVARPAADPPGTGEVAVTYTITPSVVSIEPAVVRPGAPIHVHLKGVGWTETANTYTLDLDDAFAGYACGFNSQGDVAIRLRAPGRVGVHYIDLWPTIYRGQIMGPGAPPDSADVNGSYLLLPMLNVIDHPGERLPAFHLAFDVRA